MPDIASALKDEIKRVARREINAFITPVKKSTTSLRKSVADVAKRVTALQKDIRKYGRQIDEHKAPAVHATVTIAPPDNFKITATQLKTLRGRLGISQKQLATIIGASVQSVTLWETKPGRIQIRDSSVRGKLVELKGVKRAEVYDKYGIENPARKRKKRMDG